MFLSCGNFPASECSCVSDYNTGEISCVELNQPCTACRFSTDCTNGTGGVRTEHLIVALQILGSIDKRSTNSFALWIPAASFLFASILVHAELQPKSDLWR